MAFVRRQHKRSKSTSTSSSNSNNDGPLGCDTFVALPPATPAGVCIFGKNSDRPTGEGQSIRRYPAADYDNSDEKPPRMLKCTYLSIPQVSHTHAVLLSQMVSESFSSRRIIHNASLLVIYTKCFKPFY